MILSHLFQKYDNGKMSSYLKSLTPSTEAKPVSFKHIPFNVKIQYPFNNTKFVGMIAGGTGELSSNPQVVISSYSHCELKMKIDICFTRT